MFWFYTHFDKLTNTNLNIISAQPQDVIVRSASVKYELQS